MKRFCLYICSAVFLLSCSKNAPNYTGTPQNDDEPSSNIVNILFIGNSLTYYNDGIYTHVQSFYEAGNPDILSETFEKAHGGYTLRNHLNNQESMSLLNDPKWDYIVLQENGIVASTEPEAGWESIRDLKAIFDGKPATVLLYMTWAYENQPEMTQQLENFYKTASEITAWPVVPVGLGWRDFEAENDTIKLLSDDGVHPTIYGTYFASALFFSKISRQALSTNTYNSNLLPEDAAYLRQYAANTLALYGN